MWKFILLNVDITETQVFIKRLTITVIQVSISQYALQVQTCHGTIWPMQFVLPKTNYIG